MTPGNNIVFRVDASVQIGTGHVMRCLTLANALRERGCDCLFICREHPGNLIQAIRKQGFCVHDLPDPEGDIGATPGEAAPAHASWLRVPWRTDARQTDDGIRDLRVDWLVVDHYALDARWEECLRAKVGRVLVIDDLADRPHDADLLLDQNLGRQASDYISLVPKHCRLLIGPQYALLRPEFAGLRDGSLHRRSQPRLQQLLVTMGGVDKDNATGKVLDALRCCPLPDDLEIDVVMGSHAPSLEAVWSQAAAMPRPTRVLVGIPDMAERMAEADLAIGAAGSTSWERCCLGVPTLVLVLAANQGPIARALHSAGAALAIGSPGELTRLPDLWRSISDLNTLKKMSLAAASLTAGRGMEMVSHDMGLGVRDAN